MGWAGALEGIFKTFAKDFNARGLNLYQNFRSLPRLRRMQNAMVKVMEPAAAVPDKDITGNSGEIAILAFENSQEEAVEVAAMILGWINKDKIPPAEIAVVLSKQPELYAEFLMIELGRLGIPFRNEQKIQDLSAEPVARLIIDFLSVVLSDREPDAYGRLMQVIQDSNFDVDGDYDSRARWHRFLDQIRAQLAQGAIAPTNAASLRKLTDSFLTKLGPESLVALSADYEQGDRLDTVINDTFDRIGGFLQLEPDPAKAISRFSEDMAVRIMTIHKSKGLEFDTVVMLGIERQTFFGNVDDERAAYFVGISRAKRVLVLTTATERARPSGHNKRWDEQRAPHEEFLAYAKPFVNPD